MSVTWAKVRLKDITTILGDGLHGTPKYDDNGDYYFINGNNLDSGKISINENTKRALEEEYLKHKKNLNDRTILVSINGTLGNVALYNGEKVFLGKSACYFNVIESVNRQFVRYVVSSELFQNYIHSLATGSTIKNVSLKLMRDFEFRLPSIEIQNKISKILCDLDDKIALNIQTNQTLEAIAQAIFKSWFVDFEPVKAKMAVLEEGGTAEEVERAAMCAISGKDEAALTQLQTEQSDAYAEFAQTAALFPSAMQDSELGEIPEAWKLGEIGNEVGVVGGGTPSTKNAEFWDDGTIYWTTPKDLSNLPDKILVNTERKITQAGLKTISSGLLPIDTVLMSSRAPVGYLALAKVPLAINQGYIAMKCNQILTPEYVIQWCSSIMDQIKNRASGTTFAEISKKNFNNINVVVPSSGVLAKYSDKVSLIYKEIEALVIESKKLSELRDSLLPKLLSGEIDLSQAADMADGR
jgi:type I restriction enzyme S subunit